MLVRTELQPGIIAYLSQLLTNSGIPHAFSTRHGGVSSAPFASLNLGISGGPGVEDSIANVEENYRRLKVAMGCEHRKRCWVHQVHGCDVFHVDRQADFKNGLKGDAMICTDASQVISVKYADCVPILLASDDGQIVAAIHAGWRGVVAEVIPATLKKMQLAAGLSPGNIVAAIGPCIGFESFEVGPEVISEFRKTFGQNVPIRMNNDNTGKGHIDLQAAVAWQLISLGVRENQIDSTDQCTVANVRDFYSHRRDNGITGRMAAMIGVR